MRPKAFLRASGLMSFNPRICKRCDAPLFITLTYNPVSIHASVKDATEYFNEYMYTLTVSIHASVKDATIVTRMLFASATVSIHASVKDATRFHNTSFRSLCFNPRICKRCDQVLVWILPFSQSFNPRICKRCDGSYPRNDQSPMWFQSTHL